MDLRNVFDTINLSCVLWKHSYYGITFTKLEWISSYIFHQCQTVFFDSIQSKTEYVTHKIPLGSIMDPFLKQYDKCSITSTQSFSHINVC